MSDDFEADHGDFEEEKPSSYWGDVRKNAIEGIKQTPEVIRGMGRAVGDVAGAISPINYGKSMFQMSQGMPMEQTPTYQHADNVLNMAKEVPGAIWQGVKDTAKIPYAGYERATGTPWGQTKMGQTFREHPIGMPVNVASTVFPLAKAAGAGIKAGRAMFAGETPNILERAGARGINRAVGVTPDTVGEMTPRYPRPGQTANPAVKGVELGMDLGEEGFAGKGPTEAVDLVRNKMGEYGEATQKALQDIKAQNRRFGEWEEIANPLKHESNPIMKPFLDEANKMRDSGYPNQRFASRFHRAVYNDLAKASEARGGWLHLDDIKGQMEKIGEMFSGASDDHLKILKGLYRKLAGTYNDMVTEVAESAGRPELKKALLDANSGYSKYAKIYPDSFDAAKKTAVRKSGAWLKNPWDNTIDALDPTISGAVYKTGKALRSGFEKADELRQAPGRELKKMFAPIKNQKGAIFPEDELPVIKPGSKEGPAHALFAYEDDFGEGGAKRKIYNVFGDPNDPKIKSVGWGSSVPEERLKELGIDITGKEPPRKTNKSMFKKAE